MGFTRLPCLHGTGELLPHHFNLATALPVSAECFCCTFPTVTCGGRYPSSLPCGARTFLMLAHAIVWSAQNTYLLYSLITLFQLSFDVKKMLKILKIPAHAGNGIRSVRRAFPEIIDLLPYAPDLPAYTLCC